MKLGKNNSGSIEASGRNEILKIYHGDSPVIATAIHDGHQLRMDIAAIMRLDESARLREEDPFTGEWTNIADTRIIGLRSRFEMDLNRPREKAVYLNPEDAWGLDVWKSNPSPEIVNGSLAQYDAFYSEVHRILSHLTKKFGKVVVLDLHSYNYLREGPDGPPADPASNPEVNLGTGSMNREYWAPVVDRFIADLSSYNFFSRKLDVRENIKFKGGHFSRWIHQTFPDNVCAIAIEFKKFFMDEWSGRPDEEQVKEISRALKSTIPGILEEIKILGTSC